MRSGIGSLPESARAVVVTKCGEPLEVREFSLFFPAPGEILVKMDIATLCGSDVHAWEGSISRPGLPLIPGHEGVGEIVAFGEGPRVDSVGTPLNIGDRIVWEHEACGHCYACTVLQSRNVCSNRRVGMFVNADDMPFRGTMGEYCYVWPGSGRIRVPDDVKSTWASASSCAGRTVVRSMELLGGYDYQHTIVIQGAGPLGLFATAIAAMHNPAKIIVIGGPADRLATAAAFGADLTICLDDVPDPQDRKALVLDETSGRGADIVCDFAGGQYAFGEGIELAARGGRVLTVGSVGGSPQPVSAPTIVLKNLTVVGSASAEIGSYYKILEFMRRTRDRYDWDRLVSKVHYHLDEATLAFERMQRFEETKPVFEPAL